MKTMEPFLDQLSSLYWWLSVVVVGIIINLIAAYGKPKIDSSLSFVSGRWRSRTEKQRRERAAQINSLRGSKDEQIHAAIDDLRVRMTAIHDLLFSVFFMLFPVYVDLGRLTKPIFFGIAALAFFTSFLAFIKAIQIRTMINKARKQG